MCADALIEVWTFFLMAKEIGFLRIRAAKFAISVIQNKKHQLSIMCYIHRLNAKSLFLWQIINLFILFLFFPLWEVNIQYLIVSDWHRATEDVTHSP